MRIPGVAGGFAAAVIAIAVSGCAGGGDTLSQAGESLSQLKLSKTADLFTIKGAESAVLPTQDATLGKRGPVPPEQLVDAAGRCAAEVPPATDASGGATGVEATASPVGAAAPTAPVPAGQVSDPGQLPFAGGVGLGMTECEVVRRAGQPGNVTIGAAAGGDRQVVLTYLTGNFPGIYHFSSGRLKEIERAPEPPKPEKPARKRSRAKPKTATR